MAYRISISENGKYIICRVIGAMTMKTAQAFGKEMLKLARTKDIKRYLTDVREAPNISTTYDNYKFAYEEMDKLGLQRAHRSAILINPDDSSHNFVETTLKNSGFNVRIFHDEDAAIAWLNE